MERQQFLVIYRELLTMQRPPESPNVVFSDFWIVLTYLWAVIWNRPVSWACAKENWPPDFEWYTPPHPATMSRRLKTPAVHTLLTLVFNRFNDRLPQSGFKHFDGKPLTVGGYSKDPEAACGRAAGFLARGYKLHCIWDATGHIEGWEITSLNVSEVEVAKILIPKVVEPSFIITDGQNDTNELYDLAGEYHHQWLAGKRRKKAKGLGHQYQSILRLRALRMINDGVGGPLLHARDDIERRFGSLGNCPEGLTPLPNWVRRLHRVHLWIQGKFILYLQRITEKHRLAA